eukprot:scaffold321751_cov31-Tisochrysis_lutea.AAC.5
MERVPVPSSPPAHPAAPTDRAMADAAPPKRQRDSALDTQLRTSRGPCHPRQGHISARPPWIPRPSTPSHQGWPAPERTTTAPPSHLPA